MQLSDLIFLDTETTGNETDDRLCQLAWKYHGQSLDEMFSKVYKPPVPISIESMAVHHITEKMVANKPLFKSSEDYSTIKNLLEQPNSIMVAHNAPFDLDMLEKEGIKPTHAIDTLKLIRHFDPEMVIKRHNLQYLRYFLKIDEDIDYPIHAHDAKSDVIILELVFDRLYKKAQEIFKLDSESDTLQKLIELSTQPAFIGKFAFGKYVGQMVEDVAQQDPQYLKWLYNQKLDSDQDETDWLFTLKQVLNM
ncbi:MAG: exonuclease domain-containing protein [Chitinophagales bacterium]